MCSRIGRGIGTHSSRAGAAKDQVPSTKFQGKRRPMSIELEYVGNEREEEIAAELADFLSGQADALAGAAIFGPRTVEPAEVDLRTDVEMPEEWRNRPVQRVSLAVQTGVFADQHSGALGGEICPQMQNRPFAG